MLSKKFILLTVKSRNMWNVMKEVAFVQHQFLLYTSLIVLLQKVQKEKIKNKTLAVIIK